jgi:hypothetical protein
MTTARITIRRSCSGAVNIARLWVGRKVVYETRAWGAAHNAWADAEGHAAMIGVRVNASH